MNANGIRHVFVYGTLRQGEERNINRLLPAPRRVGAARVQGLMYDLGSYPGAVLGGPRWIQGEIYEITPELERILDEIEEVWPQQTGEYFKREIEVQLASRENFHLQPVETTLKNILCLVYEVAPARMAGMARMPLISCGDWTRYRKEVAAKS